MTASYAVLNCSPAYPVCHVEQTNPANCSPKLYQSCTQSHMMACSIAGIHMKTEKKTKCTTRGWLAHLHATLGHLKNYVQCASNGSNAVVGQGNFMVGYQCVTLAALLEVLYMVTHCL